MEKLPDMQEKKYYLTPLRHIWDPAMDTFLGKEELPNCKKGKPKRVSNREKKLIEL